MTKKQITEALAETTNDEPSQERFKLKKRRRMRRINRVRKNEARFRIINTGGYAPHRGYVDWDFTGTTLLHSGKHIKYPKNSNCQRWMKKETGRRIRNCADVPVKGNYYRRLFDYWWTLY
ncbi:MAG: hypothetical protein IJT79_05165 [Ruminococcus sp.]|nr:hypothetical protein [Ruminococcus sp.]